MEKQLRMYTVGHSSTTLEEFIAKLKVNNIELLVDVRSFPGSKRHPHFGKKSLRTSLSEVGIQYIHMPELGGFRSANVNSTPANAGWKNASFRHYADYTLEQEYEEGIRKLMFLAKNHITAYACSEAVCWRCHRLLISNTLVANEIEVLHITTSKKPAHDVHSVGKYGARGFVIEGKVQYPSEILKETTDE